MERLHGRKEMCVCQGDTMYEREKMRVHALSADHEVVRTFWCNNSVHTGVTKTVTLVCTFWCNNSVHTGVNQNELLYVPVGSEF